MPRAFVCFSTILLIAIASVSRNDQCTVFRTRPGPPHDFYRRRSSDRFVQGTKPVLIKGARIWTGEMNGTEVVNGDVLLDKGIIKGVGHSITPASLATYGGNLVVIDANGAWVTPGLVDIHSHHGIFPSPQLDGAKDANSLRSTIQPWLRSVDALNTHDDGYLLSITGGTTTALVLPSFTDAIGGEGYVMKLRDTSERSPTSMLLEPYLPADESSAGEPTRWRHVVHACGEIPGKMFNGTRMDNIWALRHAYMQAKVAVQRQNDHCSTGMESFPEEYEWGLLSDVLKGNVKVHAYCDEAVDIDDIIRLSREFQFPIAAIHSASDAYLVPEILRRAYGQTPAVALFATDGRQRRATYRSSEFAPRILVDHGFTVTMESRYSSGVDARYLLFEAQKAFFYGLPANWAIASVTTMPAEVIGMGHRIGYVKRGWDADVVIWDSHPMALGATPSQVIIDGIPQLGPAHVRRKPDNYQELPKVPNFDKEVQKTIEYDGLPPLIPRKVSKTLILTNVTSIYSGTSTRMNQTIPNTRDGAFVVVVTASGELTCSGSQEACLAPGLMKDASIIDLRGGSVAPAFVSFGSSLGLENIKSEASTNDGMVIDPLLKRVPIVIGGDTTVVRAVDGLKFSTRNALLAYRAGVTYAIAAPSHKGFYTGLSVQFSTGAVHSMERGAIKEEVVAIHVSIGRSKGLSISTQIAALRHLLSGTRKGAAGTWFDRVLEGSITLVVEAHSADIIATLIILKREIELENNKLIRMTITGATEAHKLAQELAEAGIGVILTPARQSPKRWETRRTLPGPPLTLENSVALLSSHGVVVGIGVEEASSVRDLRFEVAWAAIDAGKRLPREKALALASTNIENLLGVRSEDADLIITRHGDILDLSAEVIGVISRRRGLVHLM